MRENFSIWTIFEAISFSGQPVGESYGKEKGVDVSLTKEMLVNAFNQNFDLAFLFAGDEDYVGLVNEVKRYGPIVNGAFFQHGLSETLRLAFDSFLYLGPERMNQ